MCEIIGRKREIAELRRYYESGRAEFVAVYGFMTTWCFIIPDCRLTTGAVR